MSSKVEKVIRRNYPELVDAIDSPTHFANEFFREGLISPETKEAVTQPGTTRLRVDKATDLVEAVRKRLRQSPSLFPRVVRVLRRHVTTKRLGEKMAAQAGVALTEDEDDEGEEGNDGIRAGAGFKDCMMIIGFVGVVTTAVFLVNRYPIRDSKSVVQFGPWGLTVSPAYGVVFGELPYNTAVINCTLEVEPEAEITQVDFQWTESRTDVELPASVKAFSADISKRLHNSTSLKTVVSSATVLFNNVMSPGLANYFYFTCHVAATVTNSLNASMTFVRSGESQLEMKGPEAPFPPQVGEVTQLSDSVVIRWTVSSVRYTPERYTVHYGIDSAILNLTSDPVTDVRMDFRNINDQDYSIVIDGLKPAQKYYYCVNSTNSYGSSKTKKYDFTTTDSIPGPPSNPQLISTPVSPSLLVLAWAEPAQTKGKITGYEYSCYRDTVSDVIVQAGIVNSSLRAVIIDADESGLQPSTSYTCAVMASTVKGNGAAVYTTNSTGPCMKEPQALAMCACP